MAPNLMGPVATLWQPSNALRSGLYGICRANARRCRCNADLIRRIALCHDRLAFTFITHSILFSSEDASHIIAPFLWVKRINKPCAYRLSSAAEGLVNLCI